MTQKLKLITDNQLELKKELSRLKEIILDKSMELEAIKAMYADKKKEYELIDRRRAKVDGRLKVLEPKLVSKKGGVRRTSDKGSFAGLVQDQINRLIEELSELEASNKMQKQKRGEY